MAALVPGRPLIRVLVMGQDPLARSGLAALLADQPGIAVVAQVASSEDWALTLEAYGPEVVVWDVGPGVDSERTPVLERTGPPVLALVADEEQANEALAAGARGVLFRHTGGARLSVAVAALAQGLVALEEPVAEALRPRVAAAPVEALTPREREVLELLAQGLSNRRIAQDLSISEHTVKFHVNAILGKLGAQGRTEAVVQAARLGLITL
jgi:DNA-binding NarL/FixJ family response regulator